MSADTSISFTRAIVCPPADTFADGVTMANLGPPDLALAREQHAAYCAALEAAGVHLITLPPDPHHPDSTFVEDTAVVTDRGAILTRPGAVTREGEIDAMRTALRAWYANLAEIRHPSTVDGGDVCQVGEHVFIGQSVRTNFGGAEELAGWLGRHDYTTSIIEVGRDPTLLHLKSGLAALGDNRLVAVPWLARHEALKGYEVVVVDEDEAYAANCVRVNDVVLMAAGFPKTAAAIERLGYQVVRLEMSEFRKMDGGVSCLSVRM